MPACLPYYEAAEAVLVYIIMRFCGNPFTTNGECVTMKLHQTISNYADYGSGGM